MDDHDLVKQVLHPADVTHLHVVADFDHTLTTHNSKQCHDTLLNDTHMPEAFCQEMSKLLDFSVPNPVLENKPHSYWWEYTHELLIQNNISEEQLKTLLEEESKHIKLREGAKELLAEFNRLHIPVTIVSAGFSHIIEEVLRLEDAAFQNIRILSNKLLFENGKIIGSHPSPPVHSRNKHLTYNHLQDWFDGEAEFAKIASRVPEGVYRRLLILGDSIGDIQSATGIPSVTQLKIGFFQDRRWHTKEDFEKAYDVVLPGNESFHWLLTELKKDKYTQRTTPPKEKKNV